MLFNRVFYLIFLFSEAVNASLLAQFDNGKAVCGMVNEHQSALFSKALGLNREGLFGHACTEDEAVVDE